MILTTRPAEASPRRGPATGRKRTAVREMDIRGHGWFDTWCDLSRTLCRFAGRRVRITIEDMGPTDDLNPQLELDLGHSGAKHG